jgi:hypothetical protein
VRNVPAGYRRGAEKAASNSVDETTTSLDFNMTSSSFEPSRGDLPRFRVSPMEAGIQLKTGNTRKKTGNAEKEIARP